VSGPAPSRRADGPDLTFPFAALGRQFGKPL